VTKKKKQNKQKKKKTQAKREKINSHFQDSIYQMSESAGDFSLNKLTFNSRYLIKIIKPFLTKKKK
jgi:menaquinone-dependent protoporphyrinogen IX oxidase